jgi:hypothetical protein
MLLRVPLVRLDLIIPVTVASRLRDYAQIAPRYSWYVETQQAL